MGGGVLFFIGKVGDDAPSLVTSVGEWWILESGRRVGEEFGGRRMVFLSAGGGERSSV